MIACLATVAYLGLEALTLGVHVQLAAGLPAFVMVGLADKAVAESRVPVRAALNAIGLALPPKRIVVNLSPADLPKEIADFDPSIGLDLLALLSHLKGSQLLRPPELGEAEPAVGGPDLKQVKGAGGRQARALIPYGSDT